MILKSEPGLLRRGWERFGDTDTSVTSSTPLLELHAMLKLLEDIVLPGTSLRPSLITPISAECYKQDNLGNLQLCSTKIKKFEDNFGMSMGLPFTIEAKCWTENSFY